MGRTKKRTALRPVNAGSVQICPSLRQVRTRPEFRAFLRGYFAAARFGCLAMFSIMKPANSLVLTLVAPGNWRSKS